MKKLLALLLLSPLAFAEKNEMIPLQEWMVINKDNIGASETLYVSYRCIGLYTMMYGLLLNAPQEGASWNKIYELSDANYAWNSDNKDNVIRKLKRWSKNLGWERNSK